MHINSFLKVTPMSKMLINEVYNLLILLSPKYNI